MNAPSNGKRPVRNRIKVLIAENHTLVRKGIRSLLETQPHIHVLGEATNGLEVLRKVRCCQPDVVLMDLSMAPMDGLNATRVLKQKHPEIKVLFVSIHDDEAFVQQAKEAGACGYLVKQASVPNLINALETVWRGERYFENPSKPHEDGLPPHDDEGAQVLTLREREVLKLLAEGMTLQQSADFLNVSPKTVETHRTNITRKLDIHTIAELTQYAIRHGLIELE